MTPPSKRYEEKAPSPKATGLIMRASAFSVVLGLCGLGQAWRVAAVHWRVQALIGEFVLGSAALVWGAIVIVYVLQAAQTPSLLRIEFEHPVAGGTPSLLAISTLLMVQAVLPWSRTVAWVLLILGIAWHAVFSIWHTGRMWQGGRQPADVMPTVYLPTVAGNFTASAALASLGMPDAAWLLFGAGCFSWLAMESLVVARLWHGGDWPKPQRPLLGIHFAPSAVCAASVLVIAPDVPAPLVLMLLGYALFQMLVGLGMWRWLSTGKFTMSSWAYTFGVVSASIASLKLTHLGIPVMTSLAVLIFMAANFLVVSLCWNSITSALGYRAPIGEK